MPAARGAAVRSLAEALAGEGLVLDAGADRAEALAKLSAIPGIGPWTASYVAMRALRDPDAFLAEDLGIRRGLQRLGADGRPGAVAEGWRPYRAYATRHLWASAAREQSPPLARAA